MGGRRRRRGLALGRGSEVDWGNGFV
jgi:hypothetical protein